MATEVTPPSSTHEAIMSSASNASVLMHPQDIFMAVPRMLARAGSFAFITVPEKIDHMLGFGMGGSVIAEATGNGSRNILSAALSGGPGHVAQASIGSVAATAAGPSAGGASSPRGFGAINFQQVRNFGGVLSYMTSKWALACCTLAIVLNRTQIYASARRRVSLTWPVRLILRFGPIVFFIVHALTFAQTIRCQTSPSYSYLKYGTPEKNVELDFSGEGGTLYRLSSMMLFWQDDADSCLAVGMIPAKAEHWDRRGSLSLLWPFFQSLCFGQFIETLSCALQGRPLMSETGMSIFEHSLAFAEAEGMLSNSLGMSPFGLPRVGTAMKHSGEGSDFVNRNALFYKLNTPPEVLLLALISSLNNLSSQILGVLNKQNKYRLINTGIWGLSFMSAFVWGFFSIRPDSGPEHILLRIPTVCIVGFIPHLLILLGMLLCATIYALAVFLCFVSPPAEMTRPRNWKERLRMARDNMQANSQISNIRLDMQEDFYTALLKIGFSALTVATEAVYLNEGQRISLARMTWLEQDRLKELEEFHDPSDPTRTLTVQVEDVDKLPGSDTNSTGKWRSGYALQTSFKVNKLGPKATIQRADGVGHLQRGGRYYMVFEYFEGIFWLLVGWWKILANKMLDKIGIVRRPGWLTVESDKEGIERRQDLTNAPENGSKSLDFWMLSEDGILSLPDNDDVDVAQETRKRLASANDWRDVDDEGALDTALYDWWKNNGWWGEKDDSGSYQPSCASDGGIEEEEDDDDATSIISASSAMSGTSARERDWTDVDSGRTTPTQQSYRRRSHNHRSASPRLVTDHTLNPEYLAALLNPLSDQDRHEAQMLSHHLLSPTITTRSSYARARSSRAAKLVTSTRFRPAHSSIPASGPLTRDQEAQLLEHLILESRRSRGNQQGEPANSNAANQEDHTASWRDGGDGQGSGGPQCVVCQSAPRTVLAWPCRCLSLCEECRVSLAMNNFATCVCCRRDVVGFSRLYVP